MAYLELSEKDRARYSVPERVEFQPGQIGMRAISQLRKQTGYDFEILLRLVAGVPKLDEHGEAVIEKDAEGNPVLEDDGSPKLELRHDEEALAAMVWVILWDAGHRVKWDEFDIYPLGLKLVYDDAPEEDQGKEETDTSSTTTTPD